MDAVSLDHLLAEIRPLVVGRRISRVRPAAAQAISLELSGGKDAWLWFDASRTTAGLSLLGRGQAREAKDEDAMAGRSRQALLLLRKHLDGARINAVRRVPGERVVVLEAREDVLLVVGLSGAPALGLVVEGRLIGGLGEGTPPWPLPAAAPDREWDRLDDASVEAALAKASDTRAPAARAILELCPGLGPVIAGALARRQISWLEVREGLQAPGPVLLAPAPLQMLHDADLAQPHAVDVAPFALPRSGRAALPMPSWREAVAQMLLARRRGERFHERRRAVLDEARREVRRLEQLASHLADDLAALGAADELAHQAEALLASAERREPGQTDVEVDDPYRPGAKMRIRLDRRLGVAANAERLFERARRLRRARTDVTARLGDTRQRRDAALSRLAALSAARDIAELPSAPLAARTRAAEGATGGAPRQYLSSRGLTILVGRHARENRRLTFGAARPEDFWLHARDVAGAHVIVRDPERRAAPEDLREAAELAAFFSEAAAQPLVDVHVTRRKHVHPARGGPGRVRVAHSETLRVSPRDPEGRLRRR